MDLSPSTLMAAPGHGAMQLRMEADVRRLLRRADNPFQLAALPLAQALCEATGILNAQAALRHVIESAFQEGSQEARLRDLLLSSDRRGGTSRSTTAQYFQVSKRHLQRRRAKAVSVLAQHVRKLVGGSQLVVVEDRNGAPVDPLEILAELVSGIEPATASHIIRLGGLQSVANATMLTLRGCVDVGAEIGEPSAGFERDIFPPLVAILNAQARQINGKHASVGRELWPLLDRTEGNSTEDSEVRFELEWLAFLRARQGGDARQVERVATNLRRIAHDRAAWLSRALLAQADAGIRRGRFHDAVVILDEVDRRSLRNFALVQLASGSALRSEIALLGGDAASAERLASGAYLVLRGRHVDAYRCQVTVARAAQRLRKSWCYPDDFGNLAPLAWDRVALDIERARGFIAAGDTGRAKECAGEAFRVATGLKYAGLAARAAATLGATFDRRRRQRRDWYLRALAYLLETRDRSVGSDLLMPENGAGDTALSADLMEAIPELLYHGLTRAVPQLGMQSEVESRAARAFATQLTAHVLGETSDADELHRAICTLDARASSFAQYLLHFFDEAADIFDSLFQAVAGPRRQAEVSDRLCAALQSFAAVIEPRDDLRRFLVG